MKIELNERRKQSFSSASKIKMLHGINRLLSNKLQLQGMKLQRFTVSFQFIDLSFELTLSFLEWSINNHKNINAEILTFYHDRSIKPLLAMRPKALKSVRV